MTQTSELLSDYQRTLALLTETNESARAVANTIDSIAALSTDTVDDPGLSILEVKNMTLLNYLIDLTLLVSRKCTNESRTSANGDDVIVDRLIESRTVLERIRPIDRRLKYQIDKLIKAATVDSSTSGAYDPTAFKANPDNLSSNGAGRGKEIEDDYDEDESDVEDDTKTGTTTKREYKSKVASSGVYVPPKLSAVHYTGDETVRDRERNVRDRANRLRLSSAIMDDLRDEYLDVPLEVSSGNRQNEQVTSSSSFLRQQRERQEYEEEYMTRLPIDKKEKQMLRQQQQLTTNLGDQIVGDFYGSRRTNKDGAKGKRKRASGSGGSLKKKKRRRFV